MSKDGDESRLSLIWIVFLGRFSYCLSDIKRDWPSIVFSFLQWILLESNIFPEVRLVAVFKEIAFESIPVFTLTPNPEGKFITVYFLV